MKMKSLIESWRRPRSRSWPVSINSWRTMRKIRSVSPRRPSTMVSFEIYFSILSVWLLKDTIQFSFYPKGPVTQALIMRSRTLSLHALDWLNKFGCILCGAIQPMECLLFSSLSLSLSLSLQWDRALTLMCKQCILSLSSVKTIHRQITRVGSEPTTFVCVCVNVFITWEGLKKALYNNLFVGIGYCYHRGRQG